MIYQRLILTIIIACISSIVYAHQPVMDMAPRWDDGYGFQVRHEQYGSDKLIDKTSKTSNPLNLKRYVKKTWLEGVYTFDKAVRVTFKLPYITKSRTKNIAGAAVKQKREGLGDLILGVPLKYYINQGAGTQNFGFTPSLRIPTGSSSGDYPLSDGSLDLGLSFSHSYESPKYYTLVDLFYWINRKGKRGMHEGDELGLDINLGYHPYHSNETNSGVFVMWDITTRHNEASNQSTLTGAGAGLRVQTGPVIVLYKDTVMFRAEYKHPVYERMDNISLSRGHEFNFGIGITF